MERLPNLIASLYSDGVNQSSWHVFTDQASAYFNADGCLLSFCEIHNPSDPLLFSFGSWDNESLGQLSSQKSEARFYQVIKQTPVGQILNSGDIVTPGDLTNSEADIEPSGKVEKFLGGTIYRDDKYEAVIGFVRGKDKPDFGEVDKTLLARFFPFLKQAICSYFESHLKPMQHEAEIILDQFPAATGIVSRKGKLVAANSLFEQLKQEKSLFYLYAKQMHFYDSNVQAWFSDFTQQKVSAKVRKDKSQNRSVIITGKDGQSSLLKLSYLKKPVSFVGDSENSGEFMLSIYSSTFDGRASLYRKLFDFTRAEAEVAELLSFGFTMADLAEKKKVSKHTLRTQLKSIFQKTNTHSQNELVILLSNVV